MPGGRHQARRTTGHQRTGPNYRRKSIPLHQATGQSGRIQTGCPELREIGRFLPRGSRARPGHRHGCIRLMHTNRLHRIRCPNCMRDGRKCASVTFRGSLSRQAPKRIARCWHKRSPRKALSEHQAARMRPVALGHQLSAKRRERTHRFRSSLGRRLTHQQASDLVRRLGLRPSVQTCKAHLNTPFPPDNLARWSRECTCSDSLAASADNPAT